MKISKKLFEEGETCLSSTQKIKINRGGTKKQNDWIFKINLDLEDDNEFSYQNTFLPKYLWEKPNPDEVLEFLECYVENPQFRLDKFNFDGKLSIQETIDFKNFIIEKYTDPETADESIYTATVKFKKKELIILSSRRGSSFEVIRCELLGIFRTYEEGKEFLFNDEEYMCF